VKHADKLLFLGWAVKAAEARSNVTAEDAGAVIENM
jgi:hypothetical protein